MASVPLMVPRSTNRLVPAAKMTPVANLYLVVLFIVWVRNTTNPSHPIREAFTFHFWGNRSCVTIHSIDCFNFKTLRRMPEAKNLWENIYGKSDPEVSSKCGYKSTYRSVHSVCNANNKQSLLALDPC